MTHIELSFVVITYQRGHILQDCVNSILAQNDLPVPYELIIVDNGGDAAISLPQDRQGVIFRLEVASENLGVAGGRNLGMKLAHGEILVFIDDDAIWHRNDDVVRLMSHFDSDPACGAVAAKSLNPDGKPIRFELPHPDKELLLAARTPTPVPYYYGVAHALRAAAIQEVGDYPERYFYGAEEYDLSLRLYEAGYYILFDPSICVYHHRSDAGRTIVGDRYWYNALVNKARATWRLLPYPYPITTTLIWSAQLLLKTRRPSLLTSAWRALWSERKWLQQVRQPISRETVRRLNGIGARLLY